MPEMARRSTRHGPYSTLLPKHIFTRGYAAIHEAEVDFINWLDDTALEV